MWVRSEWTWMWASDRGGHLQSRLGWPLAPVYIEHEETSVVSELEKAGAEHIRMIVDDGV